MTFLLAVDARQWRLMAPSLSAGNRTRTALASTAARDPQSTIALPANL